VNLEDLNHCDIKQAHIELLKCCGSSQWTEKSLQLGLTSQYRICWSWQVKFGLIWEKSIIWRLLLLIQKLVPVNLRIMQKIRKAGRAKNKPE